MLLSSDLPISCIRSGMKHLDFPFILAHKWNYKAYREEMGHFSNLFALVDNGVAELGHPVEVNRVVDILDQNPGWIGILPDYIHRPIQTWSSIFRVAQSRGIDPRHWGVVLHGNNSDYIRFQHDLAVSLGFAIICFPYRSTRWEYLRPDVLKLRNDQRYHLMGLNEKDDLDTYAKLPGTWSLDTSKLLKVDLSQPNWHGVPKPDTLDTALLKANTTYLRERFYGKTQSTGEPTTLLPGRSSE